MTRSRSRSPLSKKHEDTGRFKGNNNDNVEECEVLHISKIPAYWNFDRIQKFIREITKSQKIIDGITFIVILKGDNPLGGFLNTGDFLVKFKNAYICKEAYAAWTAVSQTRVMKVSYDLDNLYKKKKYYKKPFHYNLGPRSNQQIDEQVPKMGFHQSNASNNPDNYETYGLSLQYLNNLKIKLPLGNKLFISNLHPDVTEAKIREVFGLAGQLVHALVFKKDFYDPPKYFAKVQYDHPVEAVQAISMFHNQQLYSWALVVHMDMKPTVDVPEGLSGIGPGLGPNGEPLRGVRNHVELQPFKQLLNRDGDGTKEKDFGATTHNKNMSNFNTFFQPDSSTFNMASNTPMGVQPPMVAPTPMVPAPVQTQIPMPVQAPSQQGMNTFGAQSSIMNPFNSTIPALQMLQNLNQQNPAGFQQAVSTLLQNNMNTSTIQNSDPGGNMSSEWQARPNMGMQNDNTQSNYSPVENYNSNYGYNQNTDNGQRNYNDSSKYEEKHSRELRRSSREEEKSNKSDMLIFKNLPRSVTLPALKNKMLEVGELKLAEMTGQGRAIVRFVHTRDAERCIKLFDKSKVDGQIIDVRYF